MKKSRLFYIQLTFTIILCALMVAPVVLSVLAGVTENYFKGISSGLTLRWLKEVWDLYQDSIWLTLMIAISCVILTILIGVPAAYALYRSGKRLRNIAETLLMLPVAVPGLATALALLLTYGGTRWLRDSWGFILIGHVIFTLPFMVSPVLAVLRGSNVSQLEEVEDKVLEEFRTALKDEQPADCQSALRSTMTDMRACHDKMRSLKLGSNA